MPSPLFVNMNSQDVSLQLLSAAHRPVVPVEGRLHQRSHHTSHRCFVSAAVTLTVVLHAQPAPTSRDKQIFTKNCQISRYTSQSSFKSINHFYTKDSLYRGLYPLSVAAWGKQLLTILTLLSVIYLTIFTYVHMSHITFNATIIIYHPFSLMSYFHSSFHSYFFPSPVVML